MLDGMTSRTLPPTSRKEILRDVQRLVVKVGSTVLSGGDAILHQATVDRIASDLAGLRRKGREVILVSSGAILAGMGQLGLKEKPKNIPVKQAAAAVGQNYLMRSYEEAFGPHGQKVAQVLLTQDDLRSRVRYLNARNTLFALLGLQVIPVINENDTVAVEEIKFGDNDNLSALVATLVDADLLVILTDTEGLYTSDPRKDPSARLVPLVKRITEEVRLWAGDSATGLGTGGMSTKVSAARIAASSGIPTIVASGLEEGTLRRIFAGEVVGTLFLPRVSKMKSRKRWLAFATHPHGQIVVDEGAKRALIQAGRSLLPSGVLATPRPFQVGDAVSLLDSHGMEFARGLANYCSEEVDKIRGLKTAEIEGALGYKHSDEIVHRDNLVILER